MPSWKKVITSGSAAELASVYSPSITGSLLGTASFATTASYVLNAVSSSFSTTASYATTAQTASYLLGSVDPFPYTGSAEITGSLGVTGSVNVTRLGIGAIGSTSIPLDVRAQGALSTDIVLRVRNSAATGNILSLAGSTQLILGSGTTAPEGLLIAQHDFGSAQPIVTLRNGQYGNLILQVRDERTASAGSVGSIRINGIIYGGESGLTKQFDLGGHGLGASYGDSATNSVWLNDQGNLNDGAGTSVISVSSNFYINSQTNKRFLFKPSSANFGINQLTFGTNATNTLAIANGTAPTTSPTDAVQFYSNDITAGNAAPHFRTENGSIIKLYQQGPVSSSQGLADALTNLGLLSGSSTVVDATGSSAFPYTGSALITGSLGVTGSISTTTSVTASNILISGSGTDQLTVYGSGSANPLMTINGSQGELFSVTDSLSGSLLAVNNSASNPIFEVYSDNTVLLGDSNAPALYTTTVVTSVAGNNIIYNVPTASYDGAFFDYTVRSGSNARAGQLMAIWSGSAVNFTETTTTDFGSTSGVAFTVIVTGSNMALTGSTTTAGWNIKTIVRSI